MSDRVLQVGLVGVGGRGGPIRKALLQSRRMKLKSICDVNERYIERSLQDYPCEVCASYEEMLASDVDAVLLITPNSFHEAQTVGAAAAGKHVFVEKPIANRLDEAGRMIAACRDVALAVGHSARYGGRNRAMGDLIARGVLGDVCGFQACASHDNAKHSDKTWKTDPKLTPCVPLMQLGIHAIDTLHGYFGEVAAVFSHHANVSKRFDMTDTTHSLIRFENGVVGNLSCYYMVPKSGVWNFYGTAARAMAQGGRIEVLKEGASRPEYTDMPEDDARPGDVRMLDAFADAVLDGTPFPTDGVAGAKALAVVWAAVYSSELGREVTLDETLTRYGAEYLRT